MDSILLTEADPLVSITAIAYFAAPAVWPILLLCRQQFYQDLLCADSSFVQTFLWCQLFAHISNCVYCTNSNFLCKLLETFYIGDKSLMLLVITFGPIPYYAFITKIG